MDKTWHCICCQSGLSIHEPSHHHSLGYCQMELLIYQRHNWSWCLFYKSLQTYSHFFFILNGLATQMIDALQQVFAKKQNSVAKSITKFKYMPLVHSASELSWIHKKLSNSLFLFFVNFMILFVNFMLIEAQCRLENWYIKPPLKWKV